MFKFMERSPLRDPDPGTAGGGANPAGGAPNPGAASFDPALFKSEIMGEFNKTLNGFAANLKKDLPKWIQPAQPQQQAIPDDGNGTPANPPDGKSIAPEVREMMNRLAALERNNQSQAERLKQAEQLTQTEQTRRLNAERDRTVAEALNGFKFADPVYAKDARRLFASDLVWTEDGQLVGPDGIVTADEYIKQQMNTRPHWQAKAQADSAGARPGGSGGNRVWTTDDLDPAKYMAMTPPERAALDKFVSDTYRQASGQ